MSNFAYVALDGRGHEAKGLLDVIDQGEAIRRIKEMGYFPTKIVLQNQRETALPATVRPKPARRGILQMPLTGNRVSPATLCVFTRQMATLLEAGMPILRGLRILQEQETNPKLKRVIGEISGVIESGAPLSEALAQHPKVFNRLYVNMVKAGELGGVLEIVLKRLAEFMEKALRIKNKIISALFYPAAVITVAAALMGILMVFVVPRFREIFDGLLKGQPMPAFTLFVLNASQAVKNHILVTLGVMLGLAILLKVFIATKFGHRIFDRVKLNLPLLGPVFRKAAIARCTRTFGTLISSGVPMLQTLTIVKETCGNLVVGDAVGQVHESVKQGETIAAPLKASRVFPSMVVGMVDVGEQTGALPEMLMRIADNCDNDVDNAVNSMTSLLEPIMIVFLAVIVGSIVIALFLPIITIINNGVGDDDRGNI